MGQFHLFKFFCEVIFLLVSYPGCQELLSASQGCADDDSHFSFSLKQKQYSSGGGGALFLKLTLDEC